MLAFEATRDPLLGLRSRLSRRSTTGRRLQLARLHSGVDPRLALGARLVMLEGRRSGAKLTAARALEVEP